MIFQMKKKKKETQCYSRTEKIKYRFVFRQTTKPQLLHSKWNELHINTKWEMVVRLTPWKIFQNTSEKIVVSAKDSHSPIENSTSSKKDESRDFITLTW